MSFYILTLICRYTASTIYPKINTAAKTISTISTDTIHSEHIEDSLFITVLNLSTTISNLSIASFNSLLKSSIVIPPLFHILKQPTSILPTISGIQANCGISTFYKSSTVSHRLKQDYISCFYISCFYFLSYSSIFPIVIRL